MEGYERVEEKSIPLGGKKVLIKSMYTMSIFRLLKCFCLEITSLYAKFWWDSFEAKRKMHWMRWEKLCFLKELDGLNLWDIEGFNQALLAKKVWRVICGENLLVSRILKGR